MVIRYGAYTVFEDAVKSRADLKVEIPGTLNRRVAHRGRPMGIHPGMDSCPDSYESLKTNLLSYLGSECVKTILFLGTAPRDGVTTTALNVAAAMARDPRLKILLIEANFRSPGLHREFDADPPVLPGAPSVEDAAKSSPTRAPLENLLVLTIGGRVVGPVNIFESQRFMEFLEMMRTEFDYVFLDGPPLNGCSGSKAICGKVDGVVLVIESGRTRKQVAMRAKRDVVEAGGRILGVVLNKRRYHIPEWVYRKL